MSNEYETIADDSTTAAAGAPLPAASQSAYQTYQSPTDTYQGYQTAETTTVSYQQQQPVSYAAAYPTAPGASASLTPASFAPTVDETTGSLHREIISHRQGSSFTEFAEQFFLPNETIKTDVIACRHFHLENVLEKADCSVFCTNMRFFVVDTSYLKLENAMRSRDIAESFSLKMTDVSVTVRPTASFTTDMAAIVDCT